MYTNHYQKQPPQSKSISGVVFFMLIERILSEIDFRFADVTATLVGLTAGNFITVFLQHICKVCLFLLCFVL